MCGIIGYSGICPAMPRIIQGLSALEYRGYDSAGVAFFKEGKIVTVKSKGRVENLKNSLGELCESAGILCGIGHTRWATHGEPSDKNSHPHGTANVVIVHNGIIENYAEIKELLESKGYGFESETDTEVAAKLLDFFYMETNNPTESIKKMREVIRGSYAICALFRECENLIYGFRKDSPLLIARGETGCFFASDISAVIGHTNEFRRLEEDEIAVLSSREIKVFDESGALIKCSYEKTEWDVRAAEKGGFAHFMLKEICEEPDVIRKTAEAMVKDGIMHLAEKVHDIERIYIVACGTAMHAGLLGKYAIEKMSGIAVSVECASEFRYRDPVLKKSDLVVLISQSGETADTLAALRLAKKMQIPTLGIVNVHGSSVAREADSVIYTNAGPEIAVASTKAYSVQLVVMLLIAVGLSGMCGKLNDEQIKYYTENITEQVPQAVERVLTNKEKCLEVAKKYKDSESIFFMGRGVDYPLACEAALKMKEISYIHCEGIAAGEMKHGTISLIKEGVPVFALATDSKLVEKTVSNIKEVSARGAKVVLICGEKMQISRDFADDVIVVPECDEVFAPIVAATVAQLVAYYVALELGVDVDKPRNLAKSVTVE